MIIGNSKDVYFLKKALGLAKKGMGWVNPNPMVGAVLVRKGQIIAKGYHKRLGLSHAEIEAIKQAGRLPVRLNGAILYVNLEPCIHFGRTPPCVDTIVKSGISRVVCSSIDPNPAVNGLGIKALQKAGIDVSVGLLKHEARKLNEAFFTFYEKKRPFVAIKFAASLDGKISTYTGDSKWITNEKARNYARSLRGHYHAVLVGINTVLRDDPHLGVRMKGRKDPIRIILDSTLKIPLDAKALRDRNVIIVTTKKADQKKITSFQHRGLEVIIFEQKIEIVRLMKILRQKEIISVLVEGGGEVLGSFVDAKVVDKVYAFYAPILIGGERAVSAIGGQGVNLVKDAIKLEDILLKKFGDNLLTIGYT